MKQHHLRKKALKKLFPKWKRKLMKGPNKAVLNVMMTGKKVWLSKDSLEYDYYIRGNNGQLVGNWVNQSL